MKNTLVVKYGTLVGVAFMINIFYSLFTDLSVYTWDSAFRTFLFLIILYLGSIWGRMDFEHLDKD